MRKSILKASLIAMLGVAVCGNDFMNVNAAEKTLSFVQQEKVNGLIREFDLLDHSDQSKLIAILTERLSSGISPIDKLSDPEKKSQLPTMPELSPHAAPEDEQLKKLIKYCIKKNTVEHGDIRTVVKYLMPQCVKFADECNKPVFQWVCEEVLRDDDEAKVEILREFHLSVFGFIHTTFSRLAPIILNDNKDDFIGLASDPTFEDYGGDALRLAALAGVTKVFKQITMSDTLPGGRDWKKVGGLFGAALIGGNLEIIRICEQNGVTNMSDSFYRAGCGYANECAFLTPGIAEWIWTQGLIPPEKINEWLIMCVRAGNIEVIKRLVDLGIDIDSAIPDTCHLLMAVIESKNSDLVRRYFVKKAPM